MPAIPECVMSFKRSISFVSAYLYGMLDIYVRSIKDAFLARRCLQINSKVSCVARSLKLYLSGCASIKRDLLFSRCCHSKNAHFPSDVGQQALMISAPCSLM